MQMNNYIKRLVILMTRLSKCYVAYSEIICSENIRLACLYGMLYVTKTLR